MLWEDSYSLESLLNKLCLHITKQLHKEKINVSFMVNSRGKILKPLVPEVTNIVINLVNLIANRSVRIKAQMAKQYPFSGQTIYLDLSQNEQIFKLRIIDTAVISKTDLQDLQTSTAYRQVKDSIAGKFGFLSLIPYEYGLEVRVELPLPKIRLGAYLISCQSQQVAVPESCTRYILQNLSKDDFFIRDGVAYVVSQQPEGNKEIPLYQIDFSNGLVQCTNINFAENKNLYISILQVVDKHIAIISRERPLFHHVRVYSDVKLLQENSWHRSVALFAEAGHAKLVPLLGGVELLSLVEH